MFREALKALGITPKKRILFIVRGAGAGGKLDCNQERWAIYSLFWAKMVNQKMLE